MKKLLLLVCTVFAQTITAQGTVTVCWEKIAGGFSTSCAIKTDGSLWMWGTYLMSEQIGPVMEVPEQIGADTDWISIEGKENSYFGIKSDGTLWGWGENTDGQLGNGTTTFTATPIQIGVDTNWKMVSPGWRFTLAIKTDGTLWEWGNNEDNHFGNASYVNSLTPLQIGIDSDWEIVSAGYDSGLGIKTNGSLWSWGVFVGTPDKSYHQIGTDTDWKSINCGYRHNGAIKADGTLWTWGLNDFAQLGIGYYEAGDVVTVPTKINDDIWLDYKSGWYNSSALRIDGTWWKWGQVVSEELILASPIIVLEDNDWVKVSMGQWLMMGIKNDGTLWGQGPNGFHQLGIDFPPSDELLTPMQLQGCNEVTTGLNDNTLTKITLYPNPTSSKLALANAEYLNIESLTVTDMTGKLVLSQKGSNPEINVEVLPAGIYFLNVSAQEGVQHLKFVKE